MQMVPVLMGTELIGPGPIAIEVNGLTLTWVHNLFIIWALDNCARQK